LGAYQSIGLNDGLTSKHLGTRLPRPSKIFPGPYSETTGRIKMYDTFSLQAKFGGWRSVDVLELEIRNKIFLFVCFERVAQK